MIDGLLSEQRLRRKRHHSLLISSFLTSASEWPAMTPLQEQRLETSHQLLNLRTTERRPLQENIKESE